MPVKIVTDSTADIPARMASELDITVVPSYVVFGEESYRDGVELTKEQFYEKLTTTQLVPTTATPTLAVYEQAYRQLAQEADGIVSIHLAGTVSGLYSVAAVAAGNVADAQIAVIDSGQVTMGYGWMAIAAAEAAQRGETLPQIAARVEGMKERAYVLAVLDTLEFLFRGGRASWVQTMIGTLLQIKPIVEIHMGEVTPLQRSRTLKRSLDQLFDLIQSLGPLERAIVLHTNAPDLAARVADRLQVLAPDWERFIGQAGVTVATHAGPGAVGIACVTANGQD